MGEFYALPPMVQIVSGTLTLGTFANSGASSVDIVIGPSAGVWNVRTYAGASFLNINAANSEVKLGAGTTLRTSGSGFEEAQWFDNTNTCGMRMKYDGIEASSGVRILWRNNTDARNGAADIGFARNGAGIVEVNNGSAGTYRDLKFRNLLAGGGNGSYVQTPSMTVANLPAAGTAGAGARAFVTDCVGAAFGGAVAGGGANAVPVYSNGVAWLIG